MTTPASPSTRNVTILMVALLAACIAFQLNASMLGPVLVTIADELSTDEASVSLSQTAFFTSAALFSLFLPRLSDIAGRKKVLTWMLAIMTLGTVLAAMAPNIQVLYLARAIQGVSGPVVPLCLLMLRHEIDDPKLYGTLMGVVTAVNGGIAGIDAIAGGYLAAHYGFRSVFIVITIVAMISTFMVARWAPESKPSAGIPMDWLGVLCLVLSLASLLMALGQAGNVTAPNWPAVIGLGIFGVIMFICFWQVESRRKNPLVTTAYLKRRATWALLLTTVLTMTGIFAIVNGLVMSFAQNHAVGFGLSADKAALLFLTPYALIGWLVGPFSGRLAPSIGYNTVLRIGLSGSVIAILLMLFFGLNSLTMMFVAILLIGITYAGISNIILNGLGIVLSPQDNPGFLPGMNAGAFNLGAGLSFALLPAVQVIVIAAGYSVMDGYYYGILTGLVITVIAFLTSLLIPRPVDAEVDA